MSEERDWDEAHREPVQTTPRYEHYQFQEKPRTVVTKPGKSGNRKPGSSFGKKLGTTVALAVVFGLVASAVFQAANFAADKYLDEGTGSGNVQIGMTESVSDTDAGTDTDEAVENTVAENGTVAAVAQASMPSVVAITSVSVQEIPSFFGYGTRKYKSAGSGSGIIVGDNDD